MSGINKVILIGRCGKDPEVRNLENGQTVANFSLAVVESYKDKTTGERKEVVEWLNIVLWRGLADVAAKYLHKGDLVYIEGKLRTRSWEKDGIKRYITEVVGDNMTLLGSKNQASQPSQSNFGSPQPPVSTQKHGVEDDSPTEDNSDLPF